MGVSFFERMQGELVDDRGDPHPVDFEIKAEASHLEHFFRDGRTRITGVVHAPPWAEAVALEGTLELAPFGKRRIDYDFGFRGDDGLPYRFVGRKRLRARRLLRSLTHLEAELRRRQQVIATGQLVFAIETLPAFARSWWPASAIGQRPLGAPLPDGRLTVDGALGPANAALLSAFVEVLFEPGERVVPGDPETYRELLKQLSQFPATTRRVYLTALRWLDVAASVRYGHRFARLDRQQRRALLDTLEAPSPRGLRSRLVHLRRLVQYLSAPVKTVHFNRASYARAIGAPAAPPVAQVETPRHMERVIEVESLERESVVEAEVAIIGTGAGGAALAKELAQRGVAVAMIEEGRYLGRQDFADGPLERMRRAWRDGGMSFTVGRPPIALPLGRAVGGTTTINSGTCLRAPDEVLDSWWRAGFPDAFKPEHFARYYDRVAEELRVTPGADAYLGQIARVVARGADAMGLSHGPLPRNAPDCDGQGSCIFGCPTGAKQSTDVSYVPRALRAGAQLYVGLPARRLLMRGRRAVAIEARGCDRHGVERRLRVYAQHIVVACGSIHSPLLLRDNGISLPQLGRNLSLHPGMGMLARFAQRMDPWFGIPQGYGVGGHGLAGVCFEGFYLPPQLAAAAIPFSGRRLTRWMDRFDRVGQFGFMVRDEGVGRVLRDNNGRPVVHYALTAQTLERLQRGAALLAELLLRGGAEEVLPRLGTSELLRSVEAARRLASAHVSPMDFNLLGAHPLGTCRMGTRAEQAVVDFEHRVFGTDNLYVVDGAAVPSSLGVNPQMTIMALATRAAEILASRC